MLRPNFADFLKELYCLTAGELQTIDKYEVGRNLGLDKERTDNVVKQLSEAGMIIIMTESKIILSPESKKVLDTNKASS